MKVSILTLGLFAISATSFADDAITPPVPIGSRHICGIDFYPADDIKNCTQGKTIFSYVIDINGSTKNFNIIKSSGSASLDDATKACIGTWKFTPALQNGIPVEITQKRAVIWVLSGACPSYVDPDMPKGLNANLGKPQ